ncbi:MAG TPA: hypothetical protein VGU46_08350 [Acidobacteriaceae bacterium]|nr:hypothetical protein [Acidobacteriaceae bacterium]
MILTKLKLVAVSLSLSLFIVTMAHAQTTAAAPVPAQFGTAQTVFLSAAGAPSFGPRATFYTNASYESMYNALTTLKQYRLVPAPTGADLTMEISIFMTLGNASSVPAESLRLTIRDSKTQALLWTIDVPLAIGVRDKTLAKNIDDASAKIASDLKALAAGKEPQQ